MNELSLFTGAGGGVLGTKLLGWRTVGYVEWEKYCQKIIAQRIQDGILDEAPIFGDIDHFIESGAAKKYQGYVDVVTAGFPCQPFSVAGKKKGQDDERNKWPQTIQCIRDIRPRYALLENVPGLLNSGYFGEILSSLAQAGFDARWCVFGADDVGAPHRRKRLWILANSESAGLQGRDISTTESNKEPQYSNTWAEDCNGELNWWSTEPNVGRVAHGVASRVDRLKAIGNGQVPAVAATAWLLLTDQFE
jgi:DNA (cytosine-5)-methyltransferase 1